MLKQVCSSSDKATIIIACPANHSVTARAEQSPRALPAGFACGTAAVIMINFRLGHNLLADGTFTILLSKHFPELADCHAMPADLAVQPGTGYAVCLTAKLGPLACACAKIIYRLR